jgi:hypothetical protein
MAQISRQGDEVPGDRAALGTALLQHAGRERMAKVMDAGLPLTSLRRDSRSSPQGATERVVRRRRAHRPMLDGREEPVALAGALAANLEIALGAPG